MLTLEKIVATKEASMGIGSLIIFIAMLLVAGMTVSVLIQTMNTINQQALETGRETVREVASGIEVTQVSGKKNGDNITQLAIFVNPIVASDDLDLSQTYVSLSDTNKNVILFYDNNYFNDSLSTGLFDTMDVTGLDATSFGIIVIRDIDSSCSSTPPVINKQDIVVLMVNTSSCFGDGSPTSGIGTRIEVSGGVYPEVGVRGMIRFTTPAAFTSTIIDLQ